MGEDNKGARLYANVGGEWRRLEPLQDLTETDLLPDDPGPPGEPGEDLSYLRDAITMTIRGRLRQRRMSRKRFIKLMMSRGISRDGSIRVAKFWHSCGLPYSSGWTYILVFCFSNNY